MGSGQKAFGEPKLKLICFCSIDGHSCHNVFTKLPGKYGFPPGLVEEAVSPEQCRSMCATDSKCYGFTIPEPWKPFICYHFYDEHVAFIALMGYNSWMRDECDTPCKF